MCSTIGAQEGKDPFKRLGKICLLVKERGGLDIGKKLGIQKIRMCYLLYI